MRFYIPQAPVNYPTTFHKSVKTLAPFGEWIFWGLSHTFNQPSGALHSILDDLKAIEDATRSPETARILESLIGDTRNWFQSDPLMTRAAMKLSSCLRLTEQHAVCLEDDASIPTWTRSEELALKLTLDVVEQVARYHFFLEGPSDGHLEWVDESQVSLLKMDVSPPPESSVNCILMYPSQRMALARLMRAPGLYDGCADYVFERSMRVAVSLLFSDTDRFLMLRSSRSSPTDDTSPPLMVACEDYEDNHTMLETMARLLQPSLVQLVRLHCSMNNNKSTHDRALPHHCVLYGLHMSKLCLRIFAHFPLDTSGDDSTQWRFCQVLVAEHWCGVEDIENPDPEYAMWQPLYSQEDCLLGRWRTAMALFVIRSQIRELEMFLKGEGSSVNNRPYHRKDLLSNSVAPNSHHPHPRIWDKIVTISEVQSIGSPSESTIHYVKVLRAFWQAERIAIPAEWIPQFGEKLSVTPTMWDKQWEWTQVVRHLLLPLIKIALYPLRDRFVPLPLDSNDPPTTSVGPDFAHPTHMPRSQFQAGEWDDVKGEDAPYLAHIYDSQVPRVYDVLTGAIATWDDLNIFLAYSFSGFYGLSVKWTPQIRYPFEMETTPVHLLPDFAVAVQLNPPVSPWSIDRLYNAPLTISSPAVIVCVQAQNAHMESETLSEDELVDLRNLMAPHLRATSMGVGKQECGDWPPWATLFTLYIKAGILHLMACTLRWDEKKAQTDIYLVDSIPIRAVVTSSEDTQNRLRLAIALLTLRSHVYRFFERWSEIEWEESLLSGERVALNIVTGMESRLGSSGGSVGEERSQQELDDIIGQFIEAIGGMATDLEEGSLETETTIVDSEGYRVIKERIDSWEDKGHDELSC